MKTSRLNPVATSTVNAADRGIFLGLDLTDAVADLSSLPLRYGGPADIFAGTWHSPSCAMKVAVKVVRSAGIGHDILLRRLRREIWVWQQLEHPNIHPLCGLYWGASHLPALVSPWCANGDVNTYLSARCLDDDLDSIKLRLLQQAMVGISYLHTHNPSIVHGDIKAANVLVSDSGIARVCDFGLASIVAEHTSTNYNTSLKGTCRWMAPELFESDDSRHSTRSDIWACGCLILEVLSGEVPYATIPNHGAVILAISRGERPGRAASISEPHWQLVSRCCSGAPDERPKIDHIIDALHKIQRLIEVATRVCSDSKRMGVQRLLDAVVTALERHAYAGQMFDGRQIELLQLLADTQIHDERLDRLMTQMAAVCIDQFAAGRADPALVQTTATIATAIRDDTQSSSSERRRYAPSLLRPLASTVARIDPAAASRLMRVLSTSLVDEISCDDRPMSLAFFPCSRRILSTTRWGYHVWDIASASCHLVVGRTLRSTNVVNHVAVSPDGTRVVSCSKDAHVRIWDACTGQLIGWPLRGHKREVRSAVFAPDGSRVLSGSFDRTLRIWVVPRRRRVVWPWAKCAVGPIDVGVPVDAVAWSPDSSLVVAGGHQRTIAICDAVTGAFLRRLQLGTSVLGSPRTPLSVYALSFSPDGTHLVAGEASGIVRVWNVTTGTVVVGPLVMHRKSVRDIAFSPDGTYVASVSHDDRVRIWNPLTGEQVGVPLDGCYSVAFSSDGNMLASSTERNEIKIWDMTSSWLRYD